MIVPDLGKESLFLNRTQSRPDLSQLALVAVPVQAQGQTLGVLSVGRVFPAGSASLDEDVHVLTVVASLIGQAVKLQRMVDDERRALEAMNLSRSTSCRQNIAPRRSLGAVRDGRGVRGHREVGGSAPRVLLLGRAGPARS
jgi:Nif-specific regulatory protein